MNCETNFDVNQNAKYTELLSAARDYVTVKPVDTPRTIYLVGKAKGERGYREFSAAIGTSISFISYVLNGQSIKIRNKVIAGLVNAAADGSGVTLEALMDAQGRIHKKDLDSFEANYQSDIRRILIDQLLEAGYEVEFSEYYRVEHASIDSIIMLRLKLPDSDKFIPCDFKIKTCPIIKTTDDVDGMTSSWLNETIAVNFFQKTRLFLVVDNPVIYQKILEKVEQIRIPNDISVLLVSPQKRIVISENAVPRSDGETAEPLFPEYKADVDQAGYYPFREIYIKEARSLITEKLMGKGCQIWLTDPGSCQPSDQIGHIKPDFTIAVKSSRKKPFQWAFTLMLLPEDTDETAATEEIRAWVSKAIVYYYLGGRLDRLSLVVDSEQIYNYVLNEISTLCMNDEISVICISFLRRQIIYEYRASRNQANKLKAVLTLI